MNNGLVRYIVISSLLMVTFIFNLSGSFAQEKQGIPANFFTGKWAGVIKGEEKLPGEGKLAQHMEYMLEIFNLSVKQPDEHFTGQAKLTPIKRTMYDVPEPGQIIEGIKIVEIIEIGGCFSWGDNRILLDRAAGSEIPLFAISFPHLLSSTGAKFEFKENRILINDEEKSPWFYQKVTGELYRITKIRKNFPADIKPNEPIKTDEKTQIEITFPDGLKVNVNRNTEVTIEEIKETTLLEVFKGKIRAMIEKLKVRGKFEIHTPTAIVAVRATEFELNVEDDGTTTLIVIDGEVEFSDNKNKKTVLVKKNQELVINPGELPSEPVSIDPARIINWWE